MSVSWPRTRRARVALAAANAFVLLGFVLIAFGNSAIFLGHPIAAPLSPTTVSPVFSSISDEEFLSKLNLSDLAAMDAGEMEAFFGAKERQYAERRKRIQRY